MRLDDKIFYEMIEQGIIPSDGVFSITEDMKNSYTTLYSTYSGKGMLKTVSNKNYSLKLAGISLLKLNQQRAETKDVVAKKKLEKTKSGIVYLISNPAFEDFLKIGITKNLVARLRAYQTYDPLRRYKVDHYRVVEDAKEEETYYLNHHQISLAKGEWVYKEKVKELFLSGR
jgi:hypothetical protein